MIAIKEELYEKLAKLKRGDESFSDVIEKLLTHTRKNPLAHFGIGKDLESDNLDEFEDILKQNRQISRENQKLLQI